MVCLISKIRSEITTLLTQNREKPCQYGNPVLRQACRDVPLDLINTEEFNSLINCMITIMEKYGGQGFAAPQLGIDLQVLVAQFTERDMDLAVQSYGKNGVQKRKMSIKPLHVLVNPKLKITNFNKTVFQEGCLSIENTVGFAERYKEVEIEGYNESGDHVIVRADGWFARILQHEMHHLKGLLITDYFVDQRKCKFFQK